MLKKHIITGAKGILVQLLTSIIISPLILLMFLTSFLSLSSDSLISKFSGFFVLFLIIPVYLLVYGWLANSIWGWK